MMNHKSIVHHETSVVQPIGQKEIPIFFALTEHVTVVQRSACKLPERVADRLSNVLDGYETKNLVRSQCHRGT